MRLRTTFPALGRALLAALALLLALVRAPAADLTANPASEIKDALRDGTGRVWGFGREDYGLCVLDNAEKWQPARPPEIDPRAVSVCMALRADGAVVCLWQLEETRYQCSEHLGQTSRAFPPFTMAEWQHFIKWRLTGDPKGGMWLTQEGPDIYRLTPAGAAELLHSVSEEECLPGSDKGVGPEGIWTPVCVCPDAEGRPWFWSDHSHGSSNGATIRGALVYDGGKFVQHDIVLPGGEAQKALTVLAPRDAQHLWCARMSDGLYTLDTATFKAERVLDQPREASLTLRALDGHGVAFFVVWSQERGEGAHSLWRVTGDHHWDKLIDGVDAHDDMRDQQDRVWAEGANGCFLGSVGNGIWYVPQDGSAPRRLDWRQGLPLLRPRRFISLQNGRWLGVDTVVNGKNQTWIGSPDTLLAKAADAPRIRFVRSNRPLLPDAGGHVWSTFTANSLTLREWDDERWIDHRMPTDPGPHTYLTLLNIDARRRPWLRASSQKDWTAIYDPAADHWQVFDSFEHALEAQEGRHDAEFAPLNVPYDLPRFGPDGQICYATPRSMLAVFDGHAWKQWGRAEVTNNTGTTATAFDGAPFFNRLGRVCINVDRQTWEYLPAIGWKASPTYEPGFADAVAHTDRQNPPPEAHLPFRPDSAAQDNQGTWWLLWQHVLYRARDGLCVPVFTPGEPNPFIDGTRLVSALIDGRGNAFLRRIESGGGETVIVAPPGPAPRTVAEMAAAGGDAAATPDRVAVHLTTDAAPVDGKVRFGWRLDGGEWTALAADGPAAVVTLDGLPAGAHRFEARSFDPSLQTDATPAALPFEVNIDAHAQIAGYILGLADPDYSRRAVAVAALARQPALALPALRAARAEADEDHRWWIDAAIQQAEKNHSP